ncbi:putative C6 transcription factor [Aspergillus mulundensis]|uniref:Zn(2)-C6 fungal-type domain-containing protein n=1 Tax=Aspergillus mulundensis TaxID=1810919 RepID=A0A3D8QAU0_9EURO|nr:hypothetical protein DSM5745_11152 [Aspergillus mulundensis]RDW58946.1 hypothetical protein DSM5745_11152 [Aspergillus mulundensis]
MSSDLRRPRAGACVTCRSRKRRCIPNPNGDGCQLCYEIAKPCSLSIASRPERINNGGEHLPTGGTGLSSFPLDLPSQVSPIVPETPLGELASRELCAELVQLYFRFIHDIAHTIFHEPTFLRRLYDGTAPMIQVYAMCGLAARFSSNPVFEGTAPCDRGNVFLTEAVRLCQPYIISPSLETAQAFLLIGYYFSGEGNVDGKHIYVGLARLHAERLSLNNNSNDVYQEEYRRTWLSIHITSHWSAWDMAMDPLSLPDELEFIPKIDDATFRTANTELVNVNHVQEEFRCDMWAQMARTLGIFAKVNNALRRLSRNMISFDEYCLQAAELEASLDRWADNLPPKLTWNFDNLMSLAGRRLGQIYLAMHVGFFHFKQMLFFPFLNARAVKSSRLNGALKCKDGASTVSSILQYSKNIRDCELDNFIYGHIVVVSSCVHLHTLLFSDDFRELAITRQRLVSNFQYLMALKSYWPIVEHIAIQLRTFQNSCRDSMSDPFVLDNWMVRFLIEHSSLLSERQLVQSAESEPLAAPNSKTVSGAATPAMLPTIEFLTTYADGDSSSTIPEENLTQWSDLSQLLHDREITGEALVDSALSWLLDDRGSQLSEITGAVPWQQPPPMTNETPVSAERIVAYLNATWLMLGIVFLGIKTRTRLRSFEIRAHRCHKPVDLGAKMYD